MILFPAIDLKDGRCVRLRRGELASATVFNDDPANQAQIFAQAGFTWLHCVDLDGAFEGRSINAAAIKAIRAGVDLPIQLGGGIRDRAGIDGWLEAGITRVILGTVALRDPELVRTAARANPGRIVVGIDAKDGKVAVQGWAETSELAVIELAKRFEDAGIAAIVFTDIGRDGMLQGVNVPATTTLANAIRIPVIASGGVAGLDDIQALMTAPTGNILGTILGRALYEGSITPRDALALVNSR